MTPTIRGADDATNNERDHKANPEDHWDEVYRRMSPGQLSWYQAEASTSLAFIETLALPRDAALLDVGGGTSTLVDALVSLGYSDTSVLDVSEVALAGARERVGSTRAVTWLRQDLLTWRPARRYALWHDRAVFHFLVEPEQRAAYLRALDAAVEGGGHVVIATFATDGPVQCSGLPVVRYDALSLARALGPQFAVVDTRRQEHLTPGGLVQPFTWVIARRVHIPGDCPPSGDAAASAKLGQAKGG